MLKNPHIAGIKKIILPVFLYIGLIFSSPSNAADCASTISTADASCTLSTNSVVVTSTGSITSSSAPIDRTTGTGLALGGITINSGGLLEYTSGGAVGAINLAWGTAPSPLNTVGDIIIDGTVTATGGGRGIYLNDIIVNSITIGSTGLLNSNSAFAAFLTDTARVTNDIVNNGSITSGSYSISINSLASVGGDIQNTGTITSANDVAINAGGAVGGSITNSSTGTMNGAVWVGGTVTGGIVNDGTIISSAGVAILANGTVGSAITNSTTGTIDGAVVVGGTVTGGINNAGIINNTNNANGYAISVTGNSTGGITNQATGTINGTIHANSSSSLTLDNSGQINGAVAFNATPAIINLNGTSGGITGLVSGSNTTVNTVGTFSTANDFSVDTFNVNAAADLTLNNDVTLVGGNTFTNAGNVTVVATQAPTITGNYSQSGLYTFGINSPSAYSTLNVSGNASFSGSYGFTLLSSSSLVAGNIYRGILKSTALSGFSTQTYTQTLGATSYTYSIFEDDVNAGWLSLCWGCYSGPSTVDTQQSIANTASSLQPIYTLQNTVLANSFSYDCSLFGKNGVCISAGGRNTAVQAANGLNNTSALLIASYRLDKNNSRIGAYADQNLSVNNAGSTVTLGNNTPLIGLFGVWSERPDAIGAEVKVSAAYGQKNTTITRGVVGDSEAGSGSSQLNSQGAQVVAKYGFGITENTVVSPYVGMRYTQNNMGGYTEATSATVTAPLTYSALNTNATTALAGVGARHRLTPKTMLFASAGVETDTNTANGSYYGTNSNIVGLTPVNFNANPVTTRPTASVGATYLVEKNQQLGLSGIYRQEPYQAVSTTSVFLTYTIGL